MEFADFFLLLLLLLLPLPPGPADLPGLMEAPLNYSDAVSSVPAFSVPLSERSYLEMDKLFRIYVYRGGEPPMFHYGPCKSIYSTKGLFVSETEKGNIYLTTDPDEALVSFLLFSIIMMVEYLYKHGSHEIKTP
ncbi:hypothetical protein CRG98_048243 [Punica granatum]|uniref:Uncharacterized protein n=1 Tax=Punica granatum TaxID=22663 RepID=A0A2I0HI56_PUNGR|nr:hypothetical protein CRG98_048243 [Punica granatum]